MLRIYLDKNVLSYIRNPNPNSPDYEFHKLSKELIEANKEKFLFFYSHAHILDLLEDKQEQFLQDDLNYLEEITNNNYLIHYFQQSNTDFIICSPKEAYNEAKEDRFFYNDVNNFDALLSNLPEEYSHLKNQFNSLLDMPLLDMPIPDSDQIDDRDREFIKKLIPTGGSLRDFMAHFKDLLLDFSDRNSNAYKQFRNYTRDTRKTLAKYNIDYTTLDFNEDLFNSKLGNSFRDYLNKKINPDGTKEIQEYDYHTNAYNILEILGIQHEDIEIKKGKKVLFNNTINDASHSYYAAHCNIFITNDKELYSKSKILYRFLGIDTQVFTLDEFIPKIPFLLNTEINDITTFFKSLSYDLNHGLIIKGKKYLDKIRNEQIIKPKYSYFSYFDTIKIINDNDVGSFVVLASETKTYFKYSSYKSIEYVTNKLVSILGKDDLLNEIFQYDVEVEQLSKDEWAGRKWTIGEVFISLEINKGSKKFCLLTYTINGD